jgi:hypothetical protein
MKAASKADVWFTAGTQWILAQSIWNKKAEPSCVAAPFPVDRIIGYGGPRNIDFTYNAATMIANLRLPPSK